MVGHETEHILRTLIPKERHTRHTSGGCLKVKCRTRFEFNGRSKYLWQDKDDCLHTCTFAAFWPLALTLCFWTTCTNTVCIYRIHFWRTFSHFTDKNTGPLIVPIPSTQNKGSSSTVVYPVSTGSKNQNQSPLIVPIPSSQNQGRLFASNASCCPNDLLSCFSLHNIRV